MQMSVTEVRMNYRPECGKDCANEHDCALRRMLNRLKSEKAQLVRIDIEIANPANESLSLRGDGWELVDIRGRSVAGAPLCEALLPADFVAIDQWEISPNTHIRSMLAFPAGEALPSQLIYSDAQNGRRSVLLPSHPAGLHVEKMKDKTTVRVKGRGKIDIDDVRSYRDASGTRRYIFSGQ